METILLRLFLLFTDVKSLSFPNSKRNIIFFFIECFFQIFFSILLIFFFLEDFLLSTVIFSKLQYSSFILFLIHCICMRFMLDLTFQLIPYHFYTSLILLLVAQLVHNTFSNDPHLQAVFILPHNLQLYMFHCTVLS